MQATNQMLERQIINPTDKNEYTRCQACDKSLIGRKYGKNGLKGYGEFTHRSRLIALKLDADTSIVTHWQCPFCRFTFSRFS